VESHIRPRHRAKGGQVKSDKTDHTIQMAETQRKIYENTAINRGYAKGWTNIQYFTRQIPKMMEELGELTDLVIGGEANDLWRDIMFAAEVARKRFDEKGPEYWDHASDGGKFAVSTVLLMEEIADMCVVLCNMTQAISIANGSPISMMELALEKSYADIERGRRDEEEEDAAV